MPLRCCAVQILDMVRTAKELCWYFLRKVWLLLGVGPVADSLHTGFGVSGKGAGRPGAIFNVVAAFWPMKLAREPGYVISAGSRDTVSTILRLFDGPLLLREIPFERNTTGE